MTPELRMFALGMGASLTVELVSFVAAHYREPIRIPERFSRVSFYIARLGLAVAAGGFAALYPAGTDLAAIHVGASLPVFLSAIMRGAQEVVVPDKLPALAEEPTLHVVGEGEVGG